MPSLQRPLTRGIYTASLVFFHPNSEDIDVEAIRKHTTNLANAGITGFVVMGSNGEAPHLSIEERGAVIRETRSALDAIGKTDYPIIAGCSEQSVRGTVNLCRQAAAAGSDYALVLPPCYFRGGMTPNVIEGFYKDVAYQSPIPIILYSFPAVVSGIDLSSDLLIRVSQHPNVVGTKFTCADTGKLNRVASAMEKNGPYFTFGGLADFILPALVSGATGVIAGGGNIAPQTCVRVFQLWQDGKLKEAQELQRVLATGDWEHTKMGISGTKAVLEQHVGYGGVPRRPLKGIDEASMSGMLEAIRPLMDLESRLSKL